MSDPKDFIRSVEDATDDEKFALWMNEFRAWQAKSPENRISPVLEGVDGILKILFIRFLAKVAETDAVKLLVALMQDANPVIAESARKAFEKNKLAAKALYLIPALKTPHATVRLFVVEQIGLSRVEDALAPLMQLTEGADAELFLKILSAFRHLAKLDLLPLLLRYTRDGREEVRLRVLLVFAALYQAEHVRMRKYILPFVGDASALVRRTAFWALKHSRHPSDLRMFKDRSMHDESPQVRQEAVQALNHHFKPSLIPHLLHIMVHDADRYVSLRAESVLIEKPFRRLTGQLRKCVKSPDGKAANKAILLFAATHRGSREVMDFLIRECSHAKDENMQVPFIEALGILEQPDAIPYLRGLLKKGIVVAYAACVALAKIWRYVGGHFMLEILVEDGLPPVLMQVMLKHLTKKSFDPTERDIAYLNRLLEHENLNIRYLSGQVIGRNQNDICFKPLVLALRHEKDASNRASLETFFIAYLIAKPARLDEAKKHFKDCPAALAGHLAQLMQCRLDAESISRLLPFLLSLPMEDPACLDLTKKLCFLWLTRGLVSWEVFLGMLKTFKDGGLAFLDSVLVHLKREARGDVLREGDLLRIRAFFEELPVSRESVIARLFGMGPDNLLPEIVALVAESPSAHLLANNLLRQYITEGGGV